MTETRTPGISLKHTVITDECRVIHGDGGAFNKAAIALLSEYNAITRQKGDEKGIDYHLVLTVEDTKGRVCRSYHERVDQPPFNTAHDRPLSAHAKERAKRPTEVLLVVKDPAPHLTQAEKDAGCDGK